MHERKLSEGHARALLGLAEPEAMIALARQAVEEGWSVREMEARVRGDVPASPSATPEPRPAARAPAARTVTADVKRVEDALRKHLGTDVRVTTRRRGRGFLTVSYYSNDDLARLLELILGRPVPGMSRAARAVTIVIQPDGATRSQTYRRAALDAPRRHRLHGRGGRGWRSWSPRSTARCSGRPRGCPASSARWPGSRRTTPRSAS